MVSQTVGHDWVTELNWWALLGNSQDNPSKKKKLALFPLFILLLSEMFYSAFQSLQGPDSSLQPQFISLLPHWYLLIALEFLLKLKWKCWSCLTFCNPIDWSSPGFSVHGILQARIMQCVAICFCRESSQSRDWNWVSCTLGGFFPIWATIEAPEFLLNLENTSVFPAEAL